MQQQQEELDEVVDVFQEAQAISDEINYQQDQINDIINTNTDQLTGKNNRLYSSLAKSLESLAIFKIYKFKVISIINLQIILFWFNSLFYSTTYHWSSTIN